MRSILVACVVAACGGGVTRPAPVVVRLAELDATCTVGSLPLGDLEFVFAKDVARIVQDRRTVARAFGTWIAAAVARSPSGERVVLAVASGRVWRVMSNGELEDMNIRLSIREGTVTALGADESTLVIGLEDGFAVVTSGTHVSRYATDTVTHVAVMQDRVAIGYRDRVEVLDTKTNARVVYSGGADQLAFVLGSTPRLVLLQGDVVYVADPHGVLRRAMDGVRRLAVVGTDLWLQDGTGILVGDGPSWSRMSTSAQLCSGDARGAWVTTTDRTELLARATPQLAQWTTSIRPTFEQHCQECHLPGGPADLDLSTPLAWTQHRRQLLDVLMDGSMPPPGYALPPPDRETLLRILQSPAEDAGHK